MNKTIDYDINGAEFLKNTRTIFLYGEINVKAAYEVGISLKYLDYLDSTLPITLEINSVGGEVTSGLAIIDTMNYVKAPVKVVVCGMAASMAALILASGKKGMRYALPHSTIMIHQPLGGVNVSQATDIDIYAQNIIKTKQVLNEILAKACNKTIEEIEQDTDRDHYLNAYEAKEYGIIDQVIESGD